MNNKEERIFLSAERLKTIIREQRVSQHELSRKTHYPQPTISQVINRKRDISEGFAESVCKAFPEYNLEWLLGVSDTKYAMYQWFDDMFKTIADRYIKRMECYRFLLYEMRIKMDIVETGPLVKGIPEWERIMLTDKKSGKRTELYQGDLEEFFSEAILKIHSLINEDGNEKD